VPRLTGRPGEDTQGEGKIIGCDANSRRARCGCGPVGRALGHLRGGARSRSLPRLWRVVEFQAQFVFPASAGSAGPGCAGDDRASGRPIEMPPPWLRSADLLRTASRGDASSGASTRRAAEIVRLLGHSAGGRSAESLLTRLGLAVSDDTVVRHLKRHAVCPPIISALRVVGIDDWS
jgi:hypothetical protein